MPINPISHPLALERLRDAHDPMTGHVDILAAAIAIATHAQPTLQPAKIIESLDRMARDVRHIVNFNNPPIDALKDVLFTRYAFVGNTHHYQDPRNSYIHELLQRRTGLPILLSLIYVETARRAGHVAYGIGLPGHFIAAFDIDADPARRVYVDAFHRGAVLSIDACRRATKTAVADWRDEYLQPADPLYWAMRMLSNLRSTYREMGDLANTAAVLEQMLILEPANEPAGRELKMIYQLLDEQIAKNN
jgi:regulator of sirC expression with transglutaminase-like and TPR domain